MTTGIDTQTVREADQNVDPSALKQDDIEDALPEREDGQGFNKEAREYLGNKLSQERAPIREEGEQQLTDQLSEPGANGKRQLYGIDTESGRNTFVGTAKNVEARVQDDGTVLGVNTRTGTTARVGEVDLNKGSSTPRRDEW